MLHHSVVQVDRHLIPEERNKMEFSTDLGIFENQINGNLKVRSDSVKSRYSLDSYHHSNKFVKNYYF